MWAASVADFVYGTLLRPRPLRWAANAALRAMLPSRIEIEGAIVVLNPADPVISGALTLGVYEKAEINFVRSMCRPKMTVLDVGANVGLYTALCGRAVGASGVVVAVEPDPQSRKFLHQTIDANSLTNCTVIAAAASDVPGVGSLYVSHENRGDNRLYANPLAGSSIQVDVVRLDDELERREIAAIEFLKIDIQGFEPYAMSGLQRTIERSKDLVVLSELWPDGIQQAGRQAEAYLSELLGHGFELFELGRTGRMSKVTAIEPLLNKYPGRKYTNIVAIRDPNRLRTAGLI